VFLRLGCPLIRSHRLGHDRLALALILPWRSADTWHVAGTIAATSSTLDILTKPSGNAARQKLSSGSKQSRGRSGSRLSRAQRIKTDLLGVQKAVVADGGSGNTLCRPPKGAGSYLQMLTWRGAGPGVSKRAWDISAAAGSARQHPQLWAAVRPTRRSRPDRCRRTAGRTTSDQLDARAVELFVSV
jgi:hypothetical protein